tara:strand:- start:1854 stop:2060 length:207 start_codon:yes stop_codon:yes gene_type:complete
MIDDERTMHRIYVEWEGGYFVTSIDPDFDKNLQEMVTDMGRPVKVEFRAADEGWFDDPKEGTLYDGEP